eukprot:750555_1
MGAKLSCLLSLVTIATSQTLCVWNSKNDWDHLNGEYTLNGNQFTGHGSYPYWKHSSSSCQDPTQYLLATWYNPDSFHYWAVQPSLSTDWIEGYHDCSKDDEKEGLVPIDPSQCQNGWFLYHEKEETYTALTLTVTDAPCPTLSCTGIEVTNTYDTNCDRLFLKHATMDNVFEYNSGTTTIKLHGPVSTTSSYQVAVSRFAQSGIVLQIQKKFAYMP